MTFLSFVLREMHECNFVLYLLSFLSRLLSGVKDGYLSGTSGDFFFLQIVEHCMEIAPDCNSPGPTKQSFFISRLQSFKTLTKPREEFIHGDFITSSTVVLCPERAENLLQYLPIETGGFCLLGLDDIPIFQGRLKTNPSVRQL
jgi:hypothetical protein